MASGMPQGGWRITSSSPGDGAGLAGLCQGRDPGGGGLGGSEIIRPGQSNFLDAHDVEVRPLAEQPADDVAVEVLVSCQPQHGEGAINRARTPCGSKRDSFWARIVPASL